MHLGQMSIASQHKEPAHSANQPPRRTLCPGSQPHLPPPCYCAPATRSLFQGNFFQHVTFLTFEWILSLASQGSLHDRLSSLLNKAIAFLPCFFFWNVSVKMLIIARLVSFLNSSTSFAESIIYLLHLCERACSVAFQSEWAEHRLLSVWAAQEAK